MLRIIIYEIWMTITTATASAVVDTGCGGGSNCNIIHERSTVIPLVK
jgi:trans-aconitate methyltransferase